MSFHIRRAQVEDAEAACEAVRRSIAACCHEDHGGDPVRLSAWLGNKTPGSFRGWIEREGLHCVVAGSADRRIVGFGMAAAGEILLCYVTPEVRFLGVGRGVLQALERHAVAAGAAELRLESTRTALPFYRRQGYAPSGPAIAFNGMEGHPLSKRTNA